MIELTSYNIVEQDDLSGSDDDSLSNSHEDEEEEETLSENEESATTSAPLRTLGTTSIHPLFLSFLGLSFLLSLSLALRGLDFGWQLPPTVPLGNPFGFGQFDRIDEAGDRSRPTPSHVPTAAPRVIETCRPPTGIENNESSTGVLSQIYHKHFKELSTTVTAVHLSRDASIVVLLMPYHSELQCIGSCRVGRIRTYGWDCETNQYEQMAQDLLGQTKDQHFGESAQLSDNGEMLVVQSRKRVDLYQWKQTEWTQVVKHVSFSDTVQCSTNLPIFSMNSLGTVFVVLKDYQSSLLSLSLIRKHGNMWKPKKYTMTIPSESSDGCNFEIGIALSADDRTEATLFGPGIGILRANFTNGEIIEIGKAMVLNAAEDVVEHPGTGAELPPSYARYRHFQAETYGSSVLFSIGKAWPFDDPTSEPARAVMIDYRSGWTTLYNTTMPHRGEMAKMCALASGVGVLYQREQFHLQLNILVSRRHEDWHIVETVKLHVAGTREVRLSRDGSFLGVLDEKNAFYLYSLNLTGVE